MYCKWKSLLKRRQGADDRASLSQQQSSSFMSAIYDRTVRTNSYNDFVMKIDVLTGEIRAHNGNADVPSFLHISGLLEPTQEAVDDILQGQMDMEMPEMMKMALEFFENSCIASMLCGTLLQSIDEARDQCRLMEAILAGMPHSGEALGFMQQGLMAESLSEMVKATNPFAKIEASQMFADVGKRYADLSGEVEERRKVVGKKATVLRRWRGGCVAVVVAVVVGATVVAVVVATHVAVTMAGAAPVVAAAAVARRRNSQSSDRVIERCSRGTAVVGMESGGEGAGTGRVEVELGRVGIEKRSIAEMRGIGAETGNGRMEMGGIGAELVGTSSDGAGVGLVGVHMSGIGAGGPRMAGVGLEEGGRGAESSAMGAERCGVRRTGAGMGGGVGAKGGGGNQGRHGCFCWGLGMLTRQGAKLDALARGSFTVNRMLDTLRCLVTGLHDDVERNRRLVEFGWRHRDEAKCVQQVGKQLFRSHSHMVRQLANLQEQVVVCFLIINKARDIVFQEFSPSPPKT